MRSHTIARVTRALLIMATVMMLPQLASAQLPVTTKSLVLQDADAGGSITLNPASDVTTSYTLTLPAAVGGAGAFLYASNATGTLAWTDMTSVVAGWYPTWNGTAVVWTDPAGADNPNWSLTGNNIASGTKTLGFTSGMSTADISIVTKNVERIGILDDGTINVAGTVNIDGAVLINDGGSATTGIGTGGNTGTITIGDGQTITMEGSLGHTGTSSFTGNVTLAGTGSALIASNGTTASPGAVGHVLTSDGADKTPIWKSINDAVGIKATGKITITGTSTGSALLTSIEADDKVILTVEGATGVIAQIGSITVNPTTGGFSVNLSAATNCTVHYLVLN